MKHMRGFIVPGAVQLLLVIGLLVVGFGAGWEVNGWRLGTQIAEREQQIALDNSDALKEFLARQTMQADKDRRIIAKFQRDKGTLAERVNQLEVANEQLLGSKNADRPFALRFVRELNRVSGLANEAGTEVRADAASAAGIPDGPGEIAALTRGDLVTWYRRVAVQYGNCRATILRLIERDKQ